ncbi:hypothetical protein [Filimonas effusa]|uniref:Uncharacterized protein n=1 Tax=Filimonas effusa TaxID=2508721 RepID=A0A4Q1D1F3_9BACT|nr:hypothetical protein [Filimonas effusa]RXK81688.1 hypothetical protein ESB13_17990 [Filimonas effusa]
MSISEQEFIALVNKKFRFEATEEEEAMLARLVAENQKWHDIYENFEKWYFPPAIVSEVANRPKSNEINEIIRRGQRRKRLNKIILILIIAILTLSIVAISFFLLT